MSEKLKSLGEATRHIDPRWGDEETEHGLAALHSRIARERVRARVGGGLGIAAALALSIGLGVGVGRREAGMALAPTAAPPAADTVRFPEGSSATATRSGTSIQLEEVSQARVVSSLEHGAAHFEVTPNQDRDFQVRIGAVTVSVLGTIFDVVRDEQWVRVAVARGRVRVESPRGAVLLNVGEAGDFPIFGATAEAAATAAPAPANAAPKSASKQPTSPPPAWRALAKNGRVKEAFEGIRGVRPAQIRDAEELLLAADVARLSGHAEDAIPYLDRVLSEFLRDPQAPVAAFSLGRILFSRDPLAAAARFEQAYSLAPSGSLAEDALAREAEAWSRGGSAKEATRAASEYAARYPFGAHVEEMRRLVRH